MKAALIEKASLLNSSSSVVIYSKKIPFFLPLVRKHVLYYYFTKFPKINSINSGNLMFPPLSLLSTYAMPPNLAPIIVALLLFLLSVGVSSSLSISVNYCILHHSGRSCQNTY